MPDRRPEGSVLVLAGSGSCPFPLRISLCICRLAYALAMSEPTGDVYSLTVALIHGAG
jgi:hypothetical protein